jgi:hypothetical protein
MGFFDDAPRGSSSLPQGGPWDPPRHEFPRAAASAVLLARTDVVAVIVAAVWAFKEGFTFWVKAPFREPGAGCNSGRMNNLCTSACSSPMGGRSPMRAGCPARRGRCRLG